MANPLQQLGEHGQSVWLDFISRDLVTSGELQRLVRDAMVVTQHAFLGEGNFDGAGAVFVGVPPIPGYL